MALVDTIFSTYKELHLRYLLVHLLHELYNKVNQLVLQHFFCMEVTDQERNVIALFND